MARAIDLSLPLVVNTADQNVGELEQSTHESGSARVNQASAALREQLARDLRLDAIPQLDATTFPDGMFLSNEFLTLSVHGGTHMDAPFHYGPTSNGHPAKQITDIPLEWCMRPGVVLRFRNHRPLQSITAEDVEAELERIGYRITAGDIVLIETGWDAALPDPQYFTAHPGMSVEATRMLVETGVKIIGIDTNNFDLPPSHMIREYARTGDAKHLWPCHMYGRQREYVQVERLGGLDQIPSAFGFTVACFPVRIQGGGAGWVRPVAIIDEGDQA